MTTYSHSRLSCFEQCPYQYKLKYIDKVRVSIPTTIEMFLGSLVHKALEELYAKKRYTKVLSKEEVLAYYDSLWEREWDENILIVKEGLTVEHYRALGREFLERYYTHYHPFEEMTVLGLETTDYLDLPDGNRWHVRIDKLGCSGTTYFVCDYKTNKDMKTQSEADADRQLGLYAAWVKKQYSDCTEVVLLWHMLAFDKEVRSVRTEESTQRLIDETVLRIAEVENCAEFPTRTSALCSYCVYKNMCPEFVHATMIEEKKYGADEGVRLVDEYAMAVVQEKDAEQRKERLKNELIAYATQYGVSTIYGSEKQASVKAYETISFGDKELLRDVLKRKGMYEEYSQLSTVKLQGAVVKGEITDEEVSALGERGKGWRVSLKGKT